MIFTGDEWLRYTRHIQLSHFGVKGQAKLKSANVLIVGMGGLGCPVAMYLAAAGVGRLTLVDGDKVEITNLQRQVLYTEDDLGVSKSIAAKHRLSDLNSEISIKAIQSHFSTDNLNQFNDKYDLVIDCTDNFPTRYLINDFCLFNDTAWIYAGISQFEGQCALFTPGNACFRCLFPSAPKNAPDCNSAGVLGVLPGLLGVIQANEAIKFLTGLATPLDNHLLLFNALSYQMQKIQLAPSDDCKCQGLEHFIGEPEQYQLACSTSSDPLAVSPKEFNRLRDKQSTTVIDVRDSIERGGFHIGGTHSPLNELEVHMKTFSQSQTYLCYCQSGKRSAKAAELLHAQGLTARSLEGGLANWLADANRMDTSE